HHRAAHGPRYRAVADLHVAYVVETRRRVRGVNRIEAAAEIEVDNDHRPGVGDLDWRIGKQAETEAAWVSTPVDARCGPAGEYRAVLQRDARRVGVDQEDLSRSSLVGVHRHAVLRARRDPEDAEENVLHRRPPLPPVPKLRPTTARRNVLTRGGPRSDRPAAKTESATLRARHNCA